VTPEGIGGELLGEVERFYASLAGSPGQGGAEWLSEEAFAVDRVRELRARNGEREWLFDSTPRFVVELRMDAASDRRLLLTVEQGRVTVAESGLAGLGPDFLIGRRFDAEELAGAVEQNRAPGSVALAGWLRALGF